MHLFQYLFSMSPDLSEKLVKALGKTQKVNVGLPTNSSH